MAIAEIERSPDLCPSCGEEGLRVVRVMQTEATYYWVVRCKLCQHELATEDLA